MDRPHGVIREELYLNGEDMLLITKALDIYAYALIASNSYVELYRVKLLYEQLVKTLPPPEYDA